MSDAINLIDEAIQAIRDGRDATAEERQILAGWSGCGAVAQLFDDT